VIERLWNKYEKDITRKLQIEGLLKFGFDVSLINVNEELVYKTLRKSQATYTNREKFTNALIKRYSDVWSPTEVGNIIWYVGIVKKRLLYIAYLEKFMVLRPHKSIRKFLSKKENKEFLNFRDEKYQDYKVWIKAIGEKVKIAVSFRVQLKNYWIAINRIIPFILREYTKAETGDLEKLGPITIYSEYSEFGKGGPEGFRKLTMKKNLSKKGVEKKNEAALRTYYTQIKEMYNKIVDKNHIKKPEQKTTDGLLLSFIDSPWKPPTEEQVELKKMMMEIYRNERNMSKKRFDLKIKAIETERKEKEAMTGEEMVITISFKNSWNRWKKYWGDRERYIILKRTWSKKEVKSIHKKYSELKNIELGDNDLSTDGLVYRKPYRQIRLKEMMMEIYRMEKEKFGVNKYLLIKKEEDDKLKRYETKHQVTVIPLGLERRAIEARNYRDDRLKKRWDDRKKNIEMKTVWSKKEVKSILKKYRELKNKKFGDNDLSTDGLVYRKPYRRRGPMLGMGGIRYRRRRSVGWSPRVNYKKNKRNDIKTSGCGGKKKKKNEK